jgi:serine/threonine-protein kinase
MRPHVRASSQADDVSQARAPLPPGDTTVPVEPIDDAGDETAIDLAIEPDEEPTTIRPARPTPMPPGVVPRRPRMARGSSHGIGERPLGHIGKYELHGKLGRGAFGVVYTARDPSLDREVAIKVLRPTHLTNQEIVQRFLQEARATARISHPGIVTIHDCGRIETNLGETAFIAMELLTGENLTSRLARTGRLAPEVAADIARQIASALEAAHRVDVLHRDLKPDNLYVVPDPAMPGGERIKVLDFGLAKLGREGHTQLQTVFGTPRYMSPEQCRSATQLDHRSDIYSLGCVLFELVTGRTPFDGDVRQLLERHQRATPPRTASLVPEVSPVLDRLIGDMLAKDPMERPQTMGAVQRALRIAMEGPASGAPRSRPDSVPPLVLPLQPGPAEPAARPVRPPSAPAVRPPSSPLVRPPSSPPIRLSPPAARLVPVPSHLGHGPLSSVEISITAMPPSTPADEPGPAPIDAGAVSGEIVVPAVPSALAPGPAPFPEHRRQPPALVGLCLLVIAAITAVALAATV